MKIALDIQPIIKNKTGVGWYTEKLIEHLPDTNLEFEGLAFNFLNPTIQDTNMKIRININKYLPYGIYRRAWDYLPLSYNTLFGSNADIYHFFNYVVPPILNGKVIVTVYDLVYKLYPQTMTKSNYKRLDKDLLRSVNRAHKVITISENSKREIIEYLGIDEAKIEIVYPGVDQKYFNHQPNAKEQEDVKSKYNLPKRYILYLGTLEPRKNVETLISAYAKYQAETDDETCLVVAGQKGWMYEQIFEKVKNAGLIDKVIFTGYVDEIDKPFIYSMAEIFVFPSFYEGFGMPVLEAMALGVPVITSNTSALPEVAGDAGFLIDPHKEDELHHALARVLHDVQLRQRMIDKGIENSKNFSWEISSAKLVDIYKKVGQK